MSNTLTDNNNVGGHPKNAAGAYSIDLQKQIVLIKNAAAEAFSDVRCHAKPLNKMVPWGSMFTAIIQRTKEKYNIPAEVILSIETIRSRAKQGVCKVAHKGLTSPMIRIEDYIVEVASQLAKVHVPITQQQGPELANSLISGV